MAAPYDLNDDKVVVIIGSGAGGGTLANELARRASNGRLLEAGARTENRRLRQRRMEHVQQDLLAGQAHHLGQLARRTRISPVCRPGSSRPSAAPPIHWAGASLRLQEHEFKARTHLRRHPRRQSAGLADDPAGDGALLRQGREQDGRDAHQRHSRPARQQQLQGDEAGANKRRLQDRATPGAWRSTPSRATAAAACQQIGFCFQGCKSGAKWSTLYTEIPKGEATGKLGAAAQSPGAADPARRQRQGDRRALCRQGRQAAGAEGARSSASPATRSRRPRLLLNSASSKFPDGLANSSGQVGRNYMRHMTGSVYGIFEKPVHMYRGTTMAGIIQDEAEHDPKRGFVGGYEMETLSLGLPFMAAFLDPGRLGPRLHLGARPLHQHGRHVDRRRGHAAGEERASRCIQPRRTSTDCRSRTCISTIIPTTSRCAAMPISRAPRSMTPSARCGRFRRRPIPRRTTWAPTG